MRNNLVLSPAGGRSIVVEQQVQKNAARREIDLHPDIAEFLRWYMTGKRGLLFRTRNGTPHLNGNLEDDWLTPRLVKNGTR